jgi:plastocyanin
MAHRLARLRGPGQDRNRKNPFEKGTSTSHVNSYRIRIIRIQIRFVVMKIWLAIASLVLSCAQVHASDDTFTLTIKDHAFWPKTLTIPAGRKVKLLVVNQDATPAEFESKSLGREKVIAGKATVVIHLGPLKPGRYPFVEEYHEKEAAAQGTIVVE